MNKVKELLIIFCFQIDIFFEAVSEAAWQSVQTKQKFLFGTVC